MHQPHLHPLDPFCRANDGKPDGGLSLIANIGSLRPEWLSLGEDLVLRRATPQESDLFWPMIRHFAPSARDVRNPFQTDIVIEPRDGGEWITWRGLDPSRFRYHVIEHTNHRCAGPDWEPKVNQVIAASVLARHELVEAFHMTWGPTQPAGGGASLDLGSFLEDADLDDKPFLSLGPIEVAELLDVRQRLRAYAEPRIRLRDAIKQYLELRRLPKRSPLRFLGLFAILESLLTHKPERTDRYDSITRQVQQKMKLLDKRFATPLPYVSFVVVPTGPPGRKNNGPSRPAKPDEVWKQMYDVRSAIAHGRVPTFTAEQSLLRDMPTAEEFLRRAVRAVMRQVLDEPQLLADLHEC